MDQPNETLNEYVVNELAKMMDRDLIIKEVCLRQNCFWDEAERLVLSIEDENRKQLEKRKSPLMLVLSSLCHSGVGVGANFFLCVGGSHLYHVERKWWSGGRCILDLQFLVIVPVSVNEHGDDHFRHDWNYPLHKAVKRRRCGRPK
ncbi:hypothetical protein EG832_13050 [bacterium]|nr:hypothetical protein [bacterium]